MFAFSVLVVQTRIIFILVGIIQMAYGMNRKLLFFKWTLEQTMEQLSGDLIFIIFFFSFVVQLIKYVNCLKYFRNELVDCNPRKFITFDTKFKKKTFTFTTASTKKFNGYRRIRRRIRLCTSKQFSNIIIHF